MKSTILTRTPLWHEDSKPHSKQQSQQCRGLSEMMRPGMVEPQQSNALLGNRCDDFAAGVMMQQLCLNDMGKLGPFALGDASTTLVSRKELLLGA